jgi:hypothetical protein
VDRLRQDHRRAINYVIQPSGAGVEIGITAIVPWVPDRPSWSSVLASATSGDHDAAPDTLVFHAGGRSITFALPATNCPQFSVHVSGHKTTYVEVGTLDTALLSTLGLPANYGR